MEVDNLMVSSGQNVHLYVSQSVAEWELIAMPVEVVSFIEPAFASDVNPVGESPFGSR